MYTIVCDRQGQKWIVTLYKDGEKVDQHSSPNHGRVTNIVNDWKKRFSVDQKDIADHGQLFAQAEKVMTSEEMEVRNSPLGGERKTIEGEAKQEVKMTDSAESEKKEPDKKTAEHKHKK